LSAFLKKLDQKKQSLQQQKQVKQAIQLYFACIYLSQLKQVISHKDTTGRGVNVSPNTISDARQEYKMLGEVSPQYGETATRKKPLKTKGADWTGVITESQNNFVFVIIRRLR